MEGFSLAPRNNNVQNPGKEIPQPKNWEIGEIPWGNGLPTFPSKRWEIKLGA